MLCWIEINGLATATVCVPHKEKISETKIIISFCSLVDDNDYLFCGPCPVLFIFLAGTREGMLYNTQHIRKHCRDKISKILHKHSHERQK